MEKKSVWEKYTEADKKKAFDFADGYKDFLSLCKTEREAVDYVINDIEKQGYVEFSKAVKSRRKLKAGDKVYFCNMNKGIILFQLGKKPLEDGMAILGAHIDSPRLDVKQNPLYEEGGMAYLDTHYYGGIKKYQWVTVPLALHGVIVKKDGTSVIINIGEEEDDPVFFVSDLLIHLASEQMEKKAAKVIEGEALDVIVGNMPLKIEPSKKSAKNKAADDKSAAKEAVKANVLDILKQYYGVEEEDFLSAEIEVVPAGKARDAGFDRSLILGYGHDDRVCAYPSYKAMLDVKNPEFTGCCILVDKEEIGSVGATGMRSRFFENCLAELMNATGSYSELALRRSLANSFMLSSDVTAGFDPSYASKFDKKNVAYMGKGFAFNKFTGSRGKSGSNDANAEYLAAIRKVMDDADAQYQVCELGAVDAGGGGTIAYIMALYAMNVIDAGVPVLNMHAPHEAISKADLYEAYRGYVAFLKGIDKAFMR
ncbi:Aspartyl aminopeptidase [Lachnospiraceae bacterium XPB1003]|nr:Aspartyl aminopeptidase [Lachnospiraceae bacterium XPB1003]